MSSEPRQIQLVGEHHALFKNGEVVGVTDNPALSGVTVVHRNQARQMVQRGEAAWVRDPDQAKQEIVEAERRQAAKAAADAERAQADAAASAAAREEQAKQDAAAAEHKREFEARFDSLSTDDRDRVLRGSRHVDARRRAAQTEQFQSLPIESQEALVRGITPRR